MKIHKTVILCLLTCFCMGITVLAAPINADVIKTDNNKTEYAKSIIWKCVNCGGSASGPNYPKSGYCHKNNNGPHDWRRVN